MRRLMRNAQCIQVIYFFFVVEENVLSAFETVDDGTGVIQCVKLHPQSMKAKQKVKQHHKPCSSIQQQLPLVQESEFPIPQYEVGDILRLAGRVEAWHDTRQIIINDIRMRFPL